MKNNQSEPGYHELKQFGLVTGLLIAGLFGLFFPWLFERTSHWWPWMIATVLILWAIRWPLTLKPVYIAWMRFGYFMNRITTPLLLGSVYFLVLTPMGLTMRLVGRDMMQMKVDPDTQSYRRQSPHRSRESMERPF